MPVPKYEVLRSGRLYHKTIHFHVSLQSTQNVTNRRRWRAPLNWAGIQLLLTQTPPSLIGLSVKLCAVQHLPSSCLQSILYEHRLAFP